MSAVISGWASPWAVLQFSGRALVSAHKNRGSISSTTKINTDQTFSKSETQLGWSFWLSIPLLVNASFIVPEFQYHIWSLPSLLLPLSMCPDIWLYKNVSTWKFRCPYLHFQLLQESLHWVPRYHPQTLLLNIKNTNFEYLSVSRLCVHGRSSHHLWLSVSVELTPELLSWSRKPSVFQLRLFSRALAFTVLSILNFLPSVLLHFKCHFKTRHFPSTLHETINSHTVQYITHYSSTFVEHL